MSNYTIDALSNLMKQASYVDKTWKTVAEFPADQFISQMSEKFSFLKLLDKNTPPCIIEKERKDGKGSFKKMLFPLNDGSCMEFDLSYNKRNIEGFEDEDELDWATIKFCVEQSLGESHMYVTGDVV